MDVECEVVGMFAPLSRMLYFVFRVEMKSRKPDCCVVDACDATPVGG
jgi:hypothetical protein